MLKGGVVGTALALVFLAMIDDGKGTPARTIENGQMILAEMTGEREITPVGMIGKRKRTPAAAKEKTNTKTRPANNQGII